MISIRGFYNRISDAIVDYAVSNTPKSVNAGNARAAGVELAYDHCLIGNLHIFTNFTYTGSRISNPIDADQQGTALSFVPDYVVNAGFELNLPGAFRVSPYLHAVGVYYDSTSRSGRSDFGPYQVLNLKVEKSLYRLDTNTVVLFADVNNVPTAAISCPGSFAIPGST